MIPVSLTIQGLYSYRKKQTIDFASMTQAGLFGIFGRVGSGKSAIIEAISFALYGETERLNTRDNRNYNMMNLKSNELLIDFEFKTGNNIRYRFVVKGKRNKLNFEDVKTLERSAYKKQENTWVPIEVSDVDHLTGLNYDNFHRTVIIPQGKFQAFLQLSPSQRTTMLQELFNLDRYELTGKITAIESRNNANIQNFKGQLLSIGEVDPNELSTKEKLLVQKRIDIIKLEEELKLKQKQSQQYEQVKTLYLKRKEEQLKITELEKDANLIGSLEKEIKEYENLIITFKSDFDRFHALEINHKKIKDELTLWQQKLYALSANIASTEKEFADLKIEYNNKEILLREAEELKKLIEIKELEARNEALIQRSLKGTEILHAKIKSIETCRQDRAALKETTEKTRKDLPDLVLLVAIKEWFTNKNNLTISISELKAKIATLNLELAAKKMFLVKLAEEREIATDQDVKSLLTSTIASLDTEKNQNEKHRHELDKTILHLEIQNKLDEFASDLEDGKPCPLCGSKHHPEVINAQSVSLELKKAREQQKELKEQIKQINDLEREVIIWRAQHIALEDQLKKENLCLEELDNKIKEHELRFVWSAFSSDNDTQLKETFKKAETVKQELEQLEQEFNRLNSQMESDEQEREKYSKTLDEFNHQITGHNSQIQLLTQQLMLIKPEEFKALSADLLKSKVEEKHNKYSTLIEKYQKKELQLTELSHQASSLAGSISANENALKSLDNDLTQLTAVIDKKLRTGNLTKEHVASVISKALNTADAKKKVETYHREVEAHTRLLNQLETELDGKVYDEKAHHEINIRLITVTQQISVLNQDIGKMQTEINHLKTNLDKLMAINTELSKLALRAEDITEMKNLFRGNAFVNFISTVYLRNLCKVANERFYRLTRQALSLELSSDNNFQVCDYMNEGKIRNVKTLSGGQTFQASLSLALALADSVQKISSTHENFFFLDEGFGMLDKDSLSIVFDTLKLLRKENRIVGVISHVEEMQQEIDVHLKITNDEENGSIIWPSWV